MATGWMKSLQCKSKVLDDVVDHHRRRSNPKNHHHHHSSNCKNSVQNLKDVVETAKQSKPKKPKPPKPPPFNRPISTKPPSAAAASLFPALTELPAGHPSRNVVEIIFHTSWGENNFSGRVEMVFKVQNMNRTVNRFDEYREVVKSRAASCAAAESGGNEDRARCVADGNEVMRFYCLGAATTATGGACEAGGGAWAFHGGKGAPTVCTFSGSGVAHDNAGGGKGRRAMLVCRVIAGRVCKPLDCDSGRNGYDSAAGKNGELFVFDTRALLPCFLIIYIL